MINKSIVGCFAVFHNNRQLRVFHKASYYDAFEKAKQFAEDNHKVGYPCTIEEFSFSSVIGALVYDTSKGEQ